MGRFRPDLAFLLVNMANEEHKYREDQHGVREADVVRQPPRPQQQQLERPLLPSELSGADSVKLRWSGTTSPISTPYVPGTTPGES